MVPVGHRRPQRLLGCIVGTAFCRPSFDKKEDLVSFWRRVCQRMWLGVHSRLVLMPKFDWIVLGFALLP